MIAGGLAARLTCVNPKVLDRAFAGREFDAALLADLPPSIDPCGERGEFHTFAYRGPMFSHPIDIHTGITVERDGFVFTDSAISQLVIWLAGQSIVLFQFFAELTHTASGQRSFQRDGGMN